MKILIFADGSASVGAGHQVRMSTLARAAVEAGHDCLLACLDLPGSSHGWAWRGLSHVTLGHESELIELTTTRRPDAVVIDSYAMLPVTLSALAERAPVVAIDDVPGRDLSAASLIVNASPGASAADYRDAAQVAAGPSYALVRPEFTPRRAAAPDGPTLVMMGATDARGLLPDLLAALLTLTTGSVTVVTGGQVPATRQDGRLEWQQRLTAPELALLMQRCATGVLTASSVCLEAAAVGLPFVAFEVADNQARLAAALRRAGVVVLTPERLDELGPSMARAAVPADLRVDGRGAARVVAAIERLAI